MSKSDSEDFNDFDSSDDEGQSNVLITSKKTKTISQNDPFNKSIESDNEVESDVEEDEKEEEKKLEVGLKPVTGEKSKEEEKDSTLKDDKVEEEESVEDKTAKLKKRLELVNALKKTNHKTGVVYLSSIPPYMKPAKLRQILSKFGQIDRLFMKKEDDAKHRQRVRGGGNKKTMYEEGWAEFIRKRDAKLCATTLNGNIIGGKKGNFYYDDILNVKYLPGFKWADLTEQIARENDIRMAKLEMEMSQANKLNAEYIRNVEKSKMFQNMQNSKKRKQQSSNDDNAEIKELDAKEANIEDNYKNFKQRRVNTNRADAPSHIKQNNFSKTLGNVLNNLL